jgi:hypothetical protein
VVEPPQSKALISVDGDVAFESWWHCIGLSKQKMSTRDRKKSGIHDQDKCGRPTGRGLKESVQSESRLGGAGRIRVGLALYGEMGTMGKLKITSTLYL